MILTISLIFAFFWILAACLTIKADAMLAGLRTDWGSLLFSLFLWWIVAILIITTPHEFQKWNNYSNGDGP